jgi:Fe-S-cluster-containing hydrogenase component 2
MNSDRFSQAVIRMATGLRQTPARCLRRRFRKNDCRLCLQACPVQAIAIDDRDIVIDADRCNECLLCAAACPSEAIEPKYHDFLRLLADIAALPQPVVACRRKEKLAAHATFNCAGFYSHEHLLALAFLLPVAVQLNLTACAGCSSGGMLPVLKERHRHLEEMLPAYRGRVLLIDNSQDLRFSPRNIGRRELFAFWGRSAKEETARFLHHLEPEGASCNFGEKYLPRRRRLLNRMAESPARAEQLRSFFFHSLRTAPGCKRCQACVAICPTGALKRGEGRSLLFQSSLCNACGLCVEFCPQSALTLHQGYTADPRVNAIIAAKPTTP